MSSPSRAEPAVDAAAMSSPSRAEPAVTRLRRDVITAVLVLAILVAQAGCSGAAPATTPLPSAGRFDRPREVNLIARDYSFTPDPVDLIPGETVLLHVVNGGLDVHEAVIGDQAVQDAWESAEAATANAPPGATPTVSVPPDLAGLRVVVASGQRVDVTWTVPADPAAVLRLIVGCHIPGHFAKGMRAAVRIPGA